MEQDPGIPGDPNAAPPRQDPGKESRKPVGRKGPPAPDINELLGIPDDAPEDTERVDARSDLFAAVASEEDEELDAALAEAARGFDWLVAVRRLLGAGPVLVLLICVILLFMFTQALTLVSQLQSMPEIAQYLGFGVLLVLLVGSMWALLRLARVFARLRTTPRIPVETLRRLGERAELRRQANARLHQARTTLRDFLAGYPLEGKTPATILLGRCHNEAEMRAIRENVGILLEGDTSTAEGWLEQFDRQFLSSIDSAARKCIRRYAVRVGIKTAALPAGFDTPVILLNAYLMARDMCVLYNLRTSGPGTAAILLRVLFNAFAAGQVSELTESAAELFFEGGGVMAAVGKSISARATEGGVNSLLFLRLGAAMVRHLRPIWPPHR